MDTLKKNVNSGIEFIVANEDVLYGKNPAEVFKAIDRLQKLHIIKKRECDGNVYEWDDMNVLMKMIG